MHCLVDDIPNGCLKPSYYFEYLLKLVVYIIPKLC